MQTSPSDLDRRAERAPTRAGATFLLLDSLLDKGGVTAVALTNDAGVFVSSTRGRCEADALAEAGARGESFDGADVFSHALRVHGERFTLVSAGGRVPRVRDVAAALARILPPRG
jgi:hypothetical protein